MTQPASAVGAPNADGVAFRPVGPVPGGGSSPLLPHARWRANRVCQSCGLPIVRGPVECCAANHWNDVPASDVPTPRAPELPESVRRTLVLGRLLRWLFGLGAAFLLLPCLLVLWPLVSFGLIHPAVALPLAFVLVVALCALAISPAAIEAPFLAAPERTPPQS